MMFLFSWIDWLTSAITDGYPWRDLCQWSEAEPARSVTRVAIRWIALLALPFVFKCSLTFDRFGCVNGDAIFHDHQLERCVLRV